MRLVLFTIRYTVKQAEEVVTTHRGQFRFRDYQLTLRKLLRATVLGLF